MSGNKILLLIVSLGLYIVARSQDPFVQQMNVGNGLPSNAVYSILEDRNGYIWFTCDEGLFRYDGKNYKSYRASNQDMYSGSGLTEDPIGRIWYQNFDGDSYYVAQDKLKKFNKKNKVNYFPNRFLNTYVFDKSENELDVYDLHSLKLVKSFPLLSDETFTTVIFKDNFYYVEGQTLFRITKDLAQKKVCDLPIYGTDFPLLFANKEHIYFLKKNGMNNAIWEIKENKSVKLTDLSSEMIVQGIKCNDSHLFLLTTCGMQRFDVRGKWLENYFPNLNLSDILIDRKKNYWFTSPNEGMALVPQLDVLQINLPKYAPLRIHPVNNKLIITTKNEQILLYNPSENGIKQLYAGKNNAEVYYVHYDTQNDQLFCVMSDGYTYYSSQANPNSFQKIIMAMKQIKPLDEKYNVFVASGTMGFFVPKNRSLTNSRFDKWISQLPMRELGDFYFYECMSGIRGKSVAIDELKQSVYFSTNIGLFAYHNGKLTEVRKNGEQALLTSLFNWKNTIFGFGGKGKVVRIQDQKICNTSAIHPDLDKANIKQIRSYNNTLLVRTLTHLYVFRNKGEATKKIAQFDLTNQECNDFALIGNTVWMVTGKGLIELNLKCATRKVKSGLFKIDQFTVNNRNYSVNKKHTFSYNQNSSTIHFSMLDFGSKTIEGVWYRVNKQHWRKLNPTIRELDFSSLSPNDYVIQFRGRVNGEMRAFQSLVFTIQPPFWNKTWFMIVIGVVLLSVFYSYFRYQLRTIRTRNQLINDKIILESDLNKSLLASIKSQMNPHFIFNALNTIQAYIFMNDKENATGYLSKFSKLTRSVLEMSEKEEIFLSEEINALELYLELEKMRFQNGFHYQLKTNTIDVESIKIPSMLIQPYVENAIKHGLLHSTIEKQLIVLFELDNHVLTVEIDDNGIGRKRAEELREQRDRFHQGFSTQANEKRLKLLGHADAVAVTFIDKYDEQKQPTGTRVILKIQLKKHQ
jgi:hypothetical protein